MQFEWDEDKRLKNITKHGADFATAYQLWQSPMLVIEDDRCDYGETRWKALGIVEQRVMVVVYTRRFDVVRIISYRKAKGRARNNILIFACPFFR